MAELLAGVCVVSECKCMPSSAGDAFCADHWKRVPREQRQELIRLRSANAHTKKFSKPYALALARAALTLETPA